MSDSGDPRVEHYIFLAFRIQWWMQIKEILLFEVGFVHIVEKSTGDQED